MASIATASPPPTVNHTIHWYRWHTSTRSLQGRASTIGSTAVLGVSSMRDLAPLRSRYGFRVIRAFSSLHAAEVKVTPMLREGAARDKRVRYLSPIGAPQHLTALPNDPLVSTLDPNTGLPYEWEFAAAHVDRALDMSPGSPTIVVGTIDTGAAAVPDLTGKVDQRWVVSTSGKVTRDTGAIDLLGHGTAVASLIAAGVNDGFGMAGFGGASHLIVMRAPKLTPTATAAGLMKLDSLGVRIVNMSFGQDAKEAPIMLDAIHKAAADGMLLVAATGNSNHAVAHPAADMQPANGVQSYGLAVGASDVHGNLAYFSNAGANLSLLAPGVYEAQCTGVLTAVSPPANQFSEACYPTWTNGTGAEYAYIAGTSFASPEVAGIAALIWAARPTLKNYQVANIIKASADRSAAGWTPTMGCGLLDAGAALELATELSATQWSTTSVASSPCAATEQG
jgi:subtilisin family serine protease